MICRIYIQQNMARIPIATLPIHYLLHIAQGIRRCGPVWCTWAFPMERYCGSLLPAIVSRRHPFKSIDRRERELEQLRQIKLLYNLGTKLDLSHSHSDGLSFISCEYYIQLYMLQAKTNAYYISDPDFTFLPPKQILRFSSRLRKLIRQCLSLELGVEEDYFRKYVRSKMECFGKVRGIGAGAQTFHAREVVSTIGQDMSYVKVCNSLCYWYS